MAIYHLHVANIGGKKSGASQSAVGFAAYISGDKIESERTGMKYDFTKKDVEYSRIYLPDHAPEKFADRSTLWNDVEKFEKADARYAKTIDAALPNELSVEESKKVMEQFANFFTDKGMICDAALHYIPGNHHIHMMLTTRKIDVDGNWMQYKEKKVFALDEEGQRIPLVDAEGNQKTDSHGRKQWKRIRVIENDWEGKEFVVKIREAWADKCNDALERKGLEDRIDHRSYEEQGIDRIPTRHEGREARELEAHGGVSDICEENRRIRAINKIHDMIEAASSGIEALKVRIDTMKADIQREYVDLMDVFRFVTEKAADIIHSHRDMEDKVDFPDADDVIRKDPDPLDRDDCWNDPV